MKAKYSLILVLSIVALSLFGLFAPVDAFEIGGLNFTAGKSPTVMSDVQIVGRSGGRSFVGGGISSKYAYRVNVADVFNVDALAIAFIAAGTFEDGDESKFIGGIGISPVAFFNGKLKTFIGYDIGNRKAIRGEMITLSTVVNF